MPQLPAEQEMVGVDVAGRTSSRPPFSAPPAQLKVPLTISAPVARSTFDVAASMSTLGQVTSAPLFSDSVPPSKSVLPALMVGTPVRSSVPLTVSVPAIVSVLPAETLPALPVTLAPLLKV
jgi:hypothetical protein